MKSRENKYGRFTTIILVAVGLLVFLVACVKLPDGGKSAFLLTSPSFENNLGEEGYQEVLKKEKLNKDPRLNKILQRVGNRVAAQTGQSYKWEFNLIESKQLNAWCMPGGKVAFYTGILPMLQDEAGMATVMGHEVAHATMRHSGQRISQGMLVNLGMTLADVSLSNNRYRNELMGMLGAGATVGVVLPYGRSHETEADLVGLKYMARAGYDPRTAVQFWQRFSKAGKGGPPEFLSTHPGGATRIANLKRNMPEAVKLYNATKKKYGSGDRL
jgi:predicted Zn-dependent protease